VWILPVDLSGITVGLPPGQHLVPWYYTDREVDDLAWLLRGVLKEVRDELHFDDATLRIATERKVRAHDALVVAKIQDPEGGLEEASQRLRAIGARYALLRFPEPQDSGYGWLEQHIKVPVISALRSSVRRPDHPLARLNIAALPVLEAATLTTDPLELLELLERTASHRTLHAGVGTDEEDYLRSLYLSAGNRLVERLSLLDDERLPQALEVVLRGKVEIADKARLRAGVDGLQGVGLAHRVGLDVSLSPLARSVADLRTLGVLETGLPEAGWTEACRALAHALRARHGAITPELTAGLSVVSPVGGDGGVRLPIELLEAPARDAFPGQPAATSTLRLLEELARLPWFKLDLPEALGRQLVESLRWLDEVMDSTSIEERRMAQVLEALLRLLAVRGRDARAQQEQAMRLLDEAIDDRSEPWMEPIRAAAMFHHTTFLIERGQGPGDLDRAAALLKECVALWERAAGAEATVNTAAGYLQLGVVATFQGNNAGAREWDEKALLVAARAGDPAAIANARRALAFDALNEGRLEEAEHRAREALEFYERIGDRYGEGTTNRALGNVALRRRDIDRAKAFFEKACALADELGDVGGWIESALRRAALGMSDGSDDMDERLLRRCIALSEEACLPRSQAIAHALMGFAQLARGATDEAAISLRRALDLAEKLDLDATVQLCRSMLSELSKSGAPARAEV
jgi:tetratricopeptide (TPR) repeat protein